MMMKPWGLLVPLALLLAGCVPSHGVPSGPSSGEIQLSGAAADSGAGYVIEPGDDIEIKFPFTPELNERQLVRPDGKMSLPLVDEVEVAGLSVDQLRELLHGRYAHELKRPEMTVAVREFGSRKVFVGGEVGAPGAIPMTGMRMTALQAILQAQGFKDTARANEVLLVRREAGDKVRWRVLDLADALDTSDISQDVLLQPRDVVFVPRSHIADVGVFVDLYIRRLLPVSPSFQVGL
jgi:protein involved in polysaccharide export with SLBB domain